MIRRTFIPLVVVVLFGSTVYGKTYDAEEDLGLVAEDASPAVAASNTAILNAALDAQWAGGKFKFRNGGTGPVLHPITCAGREFFFAGTIRTAIRYGGEIRGAGGRVPLLPSGHYLPPGGTLGGMVTRFTRIDGDKGGPILRVRGAGQTVSGIEFRGRHYYFDPTGAGPAGVKTLFKDQKRSETGIEIESRIQPPCGWNAIFDCAIADCGVGIRCLAGYYDGAGGTGKFVSQEQHADNGQVARVIFTNCDICFRTENLQAVNWSLRDIAVNDGGAPPPCIIIDCQRAGGVWADGVAINHPKTTLIRVGSSLYNPYGNWIVARNVKWDRMATYYRAFSYDGPVNPGFDLADMQWKVRIDGHLGYDPDMKPPQDVSRFIDITKGVTRFPLAGILFDVERLKLLPEFSTRFEPVDGGRWVRPTSEWLSK